MRITIDVDEQVLAAVQKATGQKKMSPAVSDALAAYLLMQRREAFVTRVMEGKTDYMATNEELEAMADPEQP